MCLMLTAGVAAAAWRAGCTSGTPDCARVLAASGVAAGAVRGQECIPNSALGVAQAEAVAASVTVAGSSSGKQQHQGSWQQQQHAVCRSSQAPRLERCWPASSFV
jgi:hypothetical protein